MANYTRNTVTGDLAPVNAELEKIEQSLKEKLDRKPSVGQANAMQDTLDMNSNRITNLPFPESNLEPLRKGDLGNNTLFTNIVNQVTVRDTDYFNVVAYGAVPDGVTDCTAAVQAAINAAVANGGGVVYFPTGRYYRSNTGPDGVSRAATWTINGDNITFKGNGESTVILHDDKNIALRSDLLSASGDNLTFKDFKVIGSRKSYTVTSEFSQTLTGGNCSNLRIENVTIEDVQNMCITFFNSDNVIVTGCTLINCARDGYRFTGGRNIKIIGNYAKNVADDVVAIHSLDAEKTTENIIVDSNVFEGCQSMKFLGAKNLTVSNNIMRRSIRTCVFIADNEATEGNTNMGNINIHNNKFLDTFTGFGTNNVIYIKGSNIVGTGTGIAGFDEQEFEYNLTNDIDDLNTPLMPIQNLVIRNNTFARTLPATADYADYGYGQFFDRVDASLAQVTGSYFRTQAITDSNFNTYSITIDAATQDTVIDGNIFKGYRLSPIRIFVRDFNIPLAHQSLSITKNTFRDVATASSAIIDFINSTTNGATVVPLIENNIFDGDPYFKHPNHNTDNTWTSGTAIEAIYYGATLFMEGAIVQGNSFSNVAGTGVRSARDTKTYKENIIYSDYTDVDVATNKGVRLIPPAINNVIVKIDGNPLNATFRQITHFPQETETAANFPLTGYWSYGHIIKNRDPATINDASTGTYIVTGWIKLATNNNGAVDGATGFAELRSFIANIT